MTEGSGAEEQTVHLVQLIHGFNREADEIIREIIFQFFFTSCHRGSYPVTVEFLPKQLCVMYSDAAAKHSGQDLQLSFAASKEVTCLRMQDTDS